MRVPSPDPDLSIHRIVGELATLHPDDVTAILDSLSQGERSAVELLLQEYGERRPGNSAPLYDPSFLSDWLRRVAQEAMDRKPTMTVPAQQLLLDCIATHHPAGRMVS